MSDKIKIDQSRLRSVYSIPNFDIDSFPPPLHQTGIKELLPPTLPPPPPLPPRPPPPLPPPPRPPPPLAVPLASTARARKRKARNIRIAVFISKGTCGLPLSADYNRHKE